MHKIAIAVTLLLLSACAGLYARISPTQRQAEPTRRPELLEAARSVLRGRGFTLDPAAAGDGVVRTLPAVQAGRVPCGLLTCRYRDTYEVTVTREGQVAVHLHRELNTPVVTPFVASLDNWEDPSALQKETIALIEAAQLEVLQEIVQ